jgi:tRNA A37 N6-isopentenylltransferase MiaA
MPCKLLAIENCSAISGEFSLQFAVEEIKKNTRRFAKRQITWFKEIKPRNGTILKRHIKQL